MPSGHTHDRITLWTLPLVTLLAGLGTRSAAIALAVGSAYLFAGLMFGGDLDTRSHQYHRWLWLRWIWLPYRRAFRHRSIWSHGPVLGTIVRLAYVGLWLATLIGIPLYVGHHLWDWPWSPNTWQQQLWQWGQVPHHRSVLLGTWIGLEAGAISHSLSDWAVSAWRRSCRPSQTPRLSTRTPQAPSHRRRS
jgi:uncharacterized metal-binding protein